MFNDFNLENMKTAKYILLVIYLAYASTTMAVEYKLHQTSSATINSYSSGGYGGIGNETMYNTTHNTSSIGASAAPVISFQSTSAMSYTGSSLPQAAITGITTTDSNAGISGPSRLGENTNNGNGPENPDDPWKTPVGDIPWLLIALLVVVTVPRLRGRLAKNNVTGETE